MGSEHGDELDVRKRLMKEGFCPSFLCAFSEILNYLLKIMPKLDVDVSKPIIMSIGGSLIVPNGGPDHAFITSLKTFVERGVQEGRKFVLVCGGGKTARHYISAAETVRDGIDPEDLDWIGIHATRLNAHLLRTVFREIAHPRVMKDPTRVPKTWEGGVLVAAGWKPGWSTDYVACRIAKRIGVNSVINASNIDYVYDADPRTKKDAKAFEELTWAQYREMVGDEWDPGLSAPFDPIASRLCDHHNISVAIVNGADFKNIDQLISQQEFVGTVIG